jgi:hypothetical protein
MSNITLADLRRNLEEKEAEYAKLSAAYPAGTVNDDRNKARREMNEVRACVDWMVRNDRAEIANLGPHMTVKLEKGQKVRIKAGSLICGTDSKIPVGGKIFPKAQDVEVHRVAKGYLDYYDGNPKVVQAAVHWAGPGGYWRWTDLNNVEII